MNNYEPKSVTGVTFEKLGKLLGPDEQGNSMGIWDPTKYEVEDSAFGFCRNEKRRPGQHPFLLGTQYR